MTSSLHGIDDHGASGHGAPGRSIRPIDRRGVRDGHPASTGETRSVRSLNSLDRPTGLVDFGALAVDVDPPATVGELRASLAICELIVATVVRREELDAEPAHLLRLVINELEADVDFLWELDPDEEGPTSCSPRPPSPDDILSLIGRIFTCGNLLSSAVSMVGIEADHARRLDAAVAELGDTVRAVWADVPADDDDRSYD